MEKKSKVDKQNVDAELKQLNAELLKTIKYGLNALDNMALYKIVGDDLPFSEVKKKIKDLDSQIFEAVDSFLELRLFIKSKK